jgi:transcriptional regulator with XRE-family HTH domain
MNVEEFKAALGPVLKSARDFSGLSAQQVADKTGVGVSTMYHWENQKTLPNIFQLFLFADAVGQTVEDLLEAAEVEYTPLSFDMDDLDFGY